MREMWELPKRGVKAQARKILLVAGVMWAVLALPLVLWLSQRETPIPPPPAQRQLTVVEVAAVRYAAADLTGKPVTLNSTVVTPMAELEITETVDPGRRVSQGTIKSGSQTAELLVVAGRTLLRGSAGFWSTVGVATTELGWVEVGDRLGAPLSFPLSDAAAAMIPGPQALMDNGSAEATSVTFRNGDLTAVFSDKGITSVSFGDRTADISSPNGPATAKLTASPPPGWDAAVAVLAGGNGALTVNPAPTTTTPPPPPPA